jgi:uncharacterized protein involved in exopolysaccharide biosynthesis
VPYKAVHRHVSFQIQGAIWKFIALLRNDEALDRQIDEFLLSAKEEDQTRCYGPELGVMLKKLDRRVEVARSMVVEISRLVIELHTTLHMSRMFISRAARTS